MLPFMNEDHPPITYFKFISQFKDKSQKTSFILIIYYAITLLALFVSVMEFTKYKLAILECLNLKLLEVISNIIIIAVTMFLAKPESFLDNDYINDALQKWHKERNTDLAENSIENQNYSKLLYKKFGKNWNNFLSFLLLFYIVILFDHLFNLELKLKNVLTVEYTYTIGNTVGKFTKTPLEYAFIIIICLLFNIRSFYVWLCYRTLHELKVQPVYDEYGNINLSGIKRDKKMMSYAMLVFILIQIYLFYFGSVSMEIVVIFSFIFSGIWGGFTLSMLTAHFESRIINVPPYTIWIIMIYAAIHPLLFTIFIKDSDLSSIGLLILFLALILKIHLFMFTYYLYCSNRIKAYFTLLPFISSEYNKLLNKITK